MNDEEANIFAQGAAGLALAAGALAEAARSLSEAAAALSVFSNLSQDDESPSTAYQSCDSATQVSESHEIDDQKDHEHEVDDDGSSAGANTGNNAHPRDMTPETPTGIRYDRHDPSPYLADPTPTKNRSETQYKPFDGQKPLESLDEIIRPGRLYLVLEEEFNALPLILACATAGKRTVCYVPTWGSLFPWETIISAIIPDRQVRSAVSFSGNTVMQLSEIVEQFASSSEGSVLVLRPTYFTRANECKAYSRTDSLILWGLPGLKFWPDVMEAVEQSPHTTLILSRREYLDPTGQAFLTGLGSSFTAHPHHSDLSHFEPGSILADFCDNVQRTVSRAQHSQNIQTIYEELLVSPINDTAYLGFVTSSSEERIEVVNKFVARVFLRGLIQDGSSRFPPSSQGLQVSDKTRKRLGTIFKTNTQTGKANPSVQPKPTPQPITNNVPLKTSGSFVFTPRPGRWCITLQRDADAIPFICYLAHQHPKSLCCISHTGSAYVYKNLFDKISTYKVIATSKKLPTIEAGLEIFSNVGLEGGLCLVRGNPLSMPDNPVSFQQVKADALIYWGLPTESSFLCPSKVSPDQFTHVYLITPPDPLPTIRNIVYRHPDLAVLNAEGENSTLHPFREKTRVALAGTSRGELKQLSAFYYPVDPPAYSVTEFLRKVMMRSDY